MGRKKSKSAIFLGVLLGIGVLIIAFLLYQLVTRPPKRPAPRIEEHIVIGPVEEVVVEPVLIETPVEVAAEEPPVFEKELVPEPIIEEELVPVLIIEELPIVVEEEPVPEPLPAATPIIIEAEPIAPDEEPSGYPFGIVPIVKSDDGTTTFDLMIVHTNDVKGNIYTENGGLGLARLSTLMKMGRAYSDNLLLLNTGDVGSVAAEHAKIAALVVDEMGYDAYLPFDIQGTTHARSLAINALDEEGYFVSQPYQIYDYNGFIVGVVGVVGPKDLPNVTFDSDLVLENAQYAVDVAHTFVDYLIVLTDLGDGPFSSTDLARSVDGIDLIIDGNGPETVLDINDTLIVRSGAELRSIGAVALTIINHEVMLTQLLAFGAEDLLNPSASELLQEYDAIAQSYGISLPGQTEEDPEIVALIGTLTEEPTAPIGPPPPPFVFDPMVFTEEEYDLFYPSATEPLPADDDFWADFFVVGEDSAVAYDDGTYYFRLFVNDDLVGTIEINFEGDARLINVEDLRFYVAEHLTPAARTRIFADLGYFVTPEELERRGVATEYDEQAFALYLTFSIQDMPERILSLSSATVNRREQYAISGAIPLKPQWFSLAANLNLFGQLEYPDDFSAFNRTLFNLSVSNRASLFGVALNYNFTLSHDKPYYNPGSWNGYYDFIDASIRFSFGNIGSGLGKLAGVTGTQSSIGVSLEKNYSFGTQSARRTQIEETLTIVEESDIEIFLNDNSFYTRTLKPGVYRLRDFILVQGANRIRIEVTPTATGIPEKPIYLNFGYDYRLLAKGDTTYAIGLNMPQTRGPNKEGSFALPWLGGDYLSYHPKAFTATYRQELGVTDALTTNIDLAFTPGTLQASLGIVFATMIGSTQIQGSTNVDTELWKASYSVNLGQRFSISETSFLNRVGLSGNYNRPVGSKGSASISLSYSDSLFNLLRYSVSGSGAYTFDAAVASWSASASTGFSPFKGFSINGSISISGSSDAAKPILTGQISGSYSFGSKASISSTNSIQTTGMNSNFSMSLRPSTNDSISLSYSGIRTGFDGSMPNFGAGVLSGSWNHSGTFSSLNLRHQYSLAKNTMTTTFMVNTALAYAGGAFGLGRSVSDSFLLVKPTGLLRRGQVSVARSLDSSPTYLPRPFGSALYNGLSTNTVNTVAVFSGGPTEFSTGSSYVYSLAPRGRQSFVATLRMQPVFTVSGVLVQKDGTPYVQYSSPVYQITTNEAGEERHDRDDTLYLFTDQDGRFILNEVKAGAYLFDLKVDDDWYGVRFDVPEQDEKTMGIDTILILESYQVGDPAFEDRVSYFDKVAVLLEAQIEDAFQLEMVEEYDARLTLNVIEQTDEESFWNTIFPSFDEDAFLVFEDDFVTEEDFYFDPLLFEELVGSWESATEGQTVTTAAP